MLYITFFYTLTYEHVGKIQKRKRKLNIHPDIHTSQTHTQLHTDKKERKKETHPNTFFSIYMKKKILKINNT